MSVCLLYTPPVHPHRPQCIGWGSCPDMSQYLEGLNSERPFCLLPLIKRRLPLSFALAVSFQLDVQGFSHVDDTSFSAYHARWPAKPLAATECCSCETQRGVDNGDLGGEGASGPDAARCRQW